MSISEWNDHVQVDRPLAVCEGETELPRLNRLHARCRHYLTAPLSSWEHSLAHDLLVNSLWFAIALTLLFAVALYAVWGYVPGLWIAVFTASFLLEAVIKIAISRRYVNASPERQIDPVWRLTFDAGVAYACVTYGLAFLAMFYPMPDENRLLLIAVFCALVCGMIAALSFYRPMALSSTPALLVPTFIVLVLTGKVEFVLLALVMLVTAVITICLSRVAQRRFQCVFDLNEKNRNLVGELRLQHARAEQLQAEAEQAVIDKSRFVAVASHDLRQPLHALGLFHHTLRLKSESESNSTLFDALDRSTTALNAMFDSLLDVSKLDANVIEPELQVFELATVFDLLEQEFSPSTREKSLYLRFTAPNVRIRTDRTLLIRILRNLISNAVKFTESGGITVEAHQNGEELVFTISDTGSGIPGHEHKNVFSEFYQLDAEQRRGAAGVGLGLSIVKRLSALLGMNVTLSCADGGGTRVTLKMEHLRPEKLASSPVQSLLSMKLAPGPAPSPIPEHTSDSLEKIPDLNGYKLEGLFLLVIDDDDDIRRGMQAMLSQEECSVICAADAQEGLDRMVALGAPPDIVVCDFQLAHGTNGADAIDTLRDHFGCELPAILVSAASSPEELLKIERSGFPSLIKPVAPDDLRMAIVSTMRKAA